jgi:glycosyltransferase involved in cell wall biosynthesis
MRFLSVATFSFPDHFGGAERVLAETAARLAARGHEVTLVTARVGDEPDEERRDGVRVIRYPIERGNPLSFHASVSRGVRYAVSRAGDAPDVVHLHQYASALAALRLPVVRGAPRVLSFYAPYHLEWLAGRLDGRPDGRAGPLLSAGAALLRRGDRRIVRGADEILVLSHFSARQVADLDAEAAARTALAPAGVDLERFRPAADANETGADAEALGLPADGVPLILSVRRLVPRMGLADLIDALGLLRKRGVRARLALAGAGPQKAELTERARAAGLGEDVRLLGRVPDNRLPALYRAANVFALPTRSLEGFGMATVEALASGLPVVATSAGATPELIEGLEGSAIVPPGDPAALGAELEKLISDSGRRARGAAASRRFAEHRLNWDGHVQAVEQAARRAIDARRERRPQFQS